MRPTGEVRQALLQAAQQGPGTLRQLAQRAQVGWDAARHTVPNMSRAGILRKVGEERVEYRNRLVHVYEAVPDAPPLPDLQPTPGWDDPVFYDLQNIFQAWQG